MEEGAEKRAALFWGVCVPLRVYLASRGDVPVLRAAAALIAYRWLSGAESKHVGFFGGPAFWAELRPVHGMLWASYAATGKSVHLWADVALGAGSWVAHKISRLSEIGM